MADRLPGEFGVLLTRPRHQSEELAREVRARGGRPVIFPGIEIVARERGDIARDSASLAEPDITIFVSRNAVECGIDFAGGQLAAIGPTTAAALQTAGFTADICPDRGFDSEHLLAEPGFSSVSGKRVRIIRGNPGREHLANELRRRGATVDYLSTYQRRTPDYDAQEIAALGRQWREKRINAVIVMSIQSLQSLASLLPPETHRELGRTLLVTPAARVLKEVLGRYPDCPAFQSAGFRADEILDCLVRAVSSTALSSPTSGAQ